MVGRLKANIKWFCLIRLVKTATPVSTGPPPAGIGGEAKTGNGWKFAFNRWDRQPHQPQPCCWQDIWIHLCWGNDQERPTKRLVVMFGGGQVGGRRWAVEEKRQWETWPACSNSYPKDSWHLALPYTPSQSASQRLTLKEHRRAETMWGAEENKCPPNLISLKREKVHIIKMRCFY